VDFFISSLFRPSPQARRGHLSACVGHAQAPARQIVYIEDTPLFVQIAGRFWDSNHLHTDYRFTRAELAAIGLQSDKGVTHEIH